MIISKEAFSVNLIPKLDDKNSWTGELEVVIMTDKENPLDSDSYNGMMHLSQIVACSVAYMEENPKMIHAIEEFLNDVEEDMEDKKLTVTGVKDNVISIDFATKTKGNA
jgi:hypothetical protein